MGSIIMGGKDVRGLGLCDELLWRWY